MMLSTELKNRSQKWIKGDNFGITSLWSEFVSNLHRNLVTYEGKGTFRTICVPTIYDSNLDDDAWARILQMTFIKRMENEGFTNISVKHDNVRTYKDLWLSSRMKFIVDFPFPAEQ